MKKRARQPVLVYLLIIALGLGGVYALLVAGAQLTVTSIVYALAPGDELLLTSISPTGAYELEVHRINPGATEPYYIRVLRTDGGRSERIYNVRGEEEAEVTWLSDEVVRINTVTLNVPAGETYQGDTHRPESMRVSIDVQAEGVYGLEMEYAIARNFLGGQSIMNAGYPDEPLPSGECVHFDLEHRRDIPMEDSLEAGAFGMVLSVYAADGEAVQLPFLYEWLTGWHSVHSFVLTGSRTEGFTLTPESAACAVIPLMDAFPAE